MPKVIGTGETVTDFIIRGEQPERMVCGGSCYNSMISLGRAGVESVFIGEVGDDRLGQRTIAFLQNNGVCADYVAQRRGHQSQLSLAFLNDKNDAEYLFYKDHSSDIFPTLLPEVEEGDVILYGSFFAINPIIRESLTSFVDRARKAGAIVYYDINFRTSHTKEKDKVLPFIVQNISEADIVRGSDEDFFNTFGAQSAQEAWEATGGRCPLLIYTCGGKSLSVFTSDGRERKYDVRPVDVVSTVGAGDSFNAGFVYRLVQMEKSLSDTPLRTLLRTNGCIDAFVASAQRFSAEVCASSENYISKTTGEELKTAELNS